MIVHPQHSAASPTTRPPRSATSVRYSSRPASSAIRRRIAASSLGWSIAVASIASAAASSARASRIVTAPSSSVPMT